MWSPYYVSMRCKNCENVRRMTFMEPLTTADAAYNYCTVCGSKRVSVYQDHENDYWITLATHYGVKPDTLKTIYQAWDHTNYPTFRGFFIAMIKEALEKGSVGE